MIRIGFSRMTAVVVLGALASVGAGCAADASDERDAREEPVGTADQALDQQQGFSESAVAFNAVNNWLNLGASTLTNQGGNLVFTASPNLASVLGPTNATRSIPTPTFHVSPDWPLPDVDCSLVWAQILDANVSLGDHTFDFLGHASAQLRCVPSVGPNFNLVISNATLTASIGVSNDQPVLASLDAGVYADATDCGLGGWCDGLVTAILPNIDPQLKAAATGFVTPILADPAAKGAIVTMVNQLANVVPQDVPWSETPGSIQLAGSTLTAQLHRTLPPKMPTNCFAWGQCGDVAVRCDNQPENFVLVRTDKNPGAVAVDTNTGRQVLTLIDSTANVDNVTTSYFVCATNPAGQVCTTTPVSAMPSPSSTCNTGGGSSGGSGGRVCTKCVLQQ